MNAKKWLVGSLAASVLAGGAGAVAAERAMGSPQQMRAMMQRMMGDILPPAIDRSILPEPQSDGARLLARYCSQCHNFPGPGMHTATEWPAVVARMVRRDRSMAGMMGVVAPGEEQVRAISDYLVAHAQVPIDRKEFGRYLKTRGGKAFSATCGQCHVLPNPPQHTAAEWPGVVARMISHEHEMHRAVPGAAAAQDIIRFLQLHAKK